MADAPDKTEPRRRRPLLAAALLFVVAGLIAAAGVVWWGWHRYTAPGPLSADVTIVIERGIGVQSIARQLAEAGVVQSRYDVLVAARLREDGQRLRAGEYAIPAGTSLRTLFDLLESGRTVVRRLTVPEGLTSTQIVALLAAEPTLTGDIGQVPPEGSLLPETYHYSLGDSRAAILARMREDMAKTLADLWSRRAPDLPIATPEQAVTLASIVEKETGVASERPRVAGVFVNRLKAGMRLQSDPTVIYGLTNGAGALDRALTRADWRHESAFNTYVIDGLPPGPIANPGRESLAAVLNPEENDFLYFVADGTGGHAFARTLEEHNRNVAAWRRIKRERGEAGADGDGQEER